MSAKHSLLEKKAIFKLLETLADDNNYLHFSSGELKAKIDEAIAPSSISRDTVRSYCNALGYSYRKNVQNHKPSHTISKGIARQTALLCAELFEACVGKEITELSAFQKLMQIATANDQNSQKK